MTVDTKFDPETQKIFDEARELATTTLEQLDLDELMDFNVYKNDIDDDYREQERRWRERQFNETVPYPVYRKLEPEGIQEKSWWPKVQPLFSEKDGKQSSGLVMMEVDNYIHKKARENPII